MSGHRESDLDLCAGHVLGALSGDDRRRFEAHLAEGCAVCTAELARLEAAAAALAHAAPPRRAPAALRARVLDAVRAEVAAARPAPAIVPLPPRRASRSFAAWGWAAAAAVLAVAGVLQWRAAVRVEAELAVVRSERVRLERLLADERAWAELPAAPRAVRVTLAATPAAAAAPLVAQVTYDPATRRALLVADHVTPGPGHDYEFWAIGSGGPVSLGLVRADAAGRAVLRVPDVGGGAPAAFAVSLEREGGAPTRTAPAGPVVMVGKLGG